MPVEISALDANKRAYCLRVTQQYSRYSENKATIRISAKLKKK